MTTKTIGMEAGAVETPAIDKSTALYSYDSKLYINNSPDAELEKLRENQLIRDFAAIKPETYDLIKSTNPTLLMMVDLAKKIMEVNG